MKIQFISFIILLTASFCKAQNENVMSNNPMMCDPEKGICEIPADTTQSQSSAVKSGNKPVKIIYFTDPICSSCWGIEPQLRKLKLEYGGEIEIEYRMGGLLKDWSYNSGGISKPSDVAHHWDEVSEYYQMPIDGDIWLEDPLDSSYPPSIAYKAAQMQDPHKAIEFLRALREMVFLKKMNITKWENMAAAAESSGLNVARLKIDYDGKAKELFEADLAMGREMGVRGFPTLFILDSTGKSSTIYGFNKYIVFENGILSSYAAASKMEYSKDWKSLFTIYPTLTLREFSELSNKATQECEAELNALVEKNELTKVATKNGDLWIRSKIE